MELNLFKNNNEANESHNAVRNFIDELTGFLNKKSYTQNASSTVQNNLSNDENLETPEIPNDDFQGIKNVKEIDKNHKEGHLYFVTSDKNNQIYLWDFTDKPEYEFEEKNIPPELKDFAKEGAMLKYENGTFSLYSEEGYDMLFEDE